MSDKLHRNQLNVRIAGFVAATLLMVSILFSFAAFEAQKGIAGMMGKPAVTNITPR